MAHGAWGTQRFNKGTLGAGATFYSNSINATALTTVTPAADILHASPWFVPEPIFMDKFEYEVSTAGASSLGLLGLYYNKEGVNGTLLPGTLIVSSAQIDQNTGLEGLKATTLTGASIIRLDAGLYWWVYCQDATAAALRAVALGAMSTTLGFTEAAPPVARVGINVANTFVPTTGTLPATFPTTGLSYVVVAQPLVIVRAVAAV